MFSKPAAVALCSALALAGCGSTVQYRAQSAAPSGDGLGQGTGSAGSAGTPTSSGTTGSTTTGSQGGSGSTGAGGSTGAIGNGTTGSGSTGSTGSAAVPGANVSATSISIGFIYTTGRQETAAALGAAGVTSGDELAQWKLLVANVNAHGGLGGRRIKPVYYGQSTTSKDTIATSETAACNTFTQDNHVAAAVSSFEYTDTFLTCMERKGVPTYYSLETVNDSKVFDAAPLHAEASNLALDRQGRELGKSLVTQGYFAGAVPAVNGIITYDTPAYVRAAKALEGTLKARGIAVRMTRTIPFPTATSDTSSAAAGISNAELAMASGGVNHVMIFDLNGLLSLLFMTNAQTQQYHPRYGLTSQSSGSHLADLLKGNANPQLKDALGIGWIPVLDLHADEYGPSQGPAARKTCRDIMVKGGQAQGLSSPGAELVALGQCDDIFLLQQAFTGLAGPVTGSSIRSAIEGVGSRFATALSLASRFGPSRHDGVSSFREMAYQTSCSCFRYTSPPRGIS
jgi:hypothetical protein